MVPNSDQRRRPQNAGGVVELMKYVAWERHTLLTRALGPVVYWRVVEEHTSHAVVVIDMLV